LSGSAAGLNAQLPGSPVEVLAELTQPWHGETRTQLVSIDGGEPVVVQSSEDGPGVARRIRVGRQLARVAPWLPIPRVLDGDAEAPLPFVVTRYVAGRGGNTLLADDEGAALLATRMGAMAGDLARVPISGLGLATTWSDAAALGVAARTWLATAADELGPTVTPTLDRLLERLPALFAGVGPVFAHGDFVPVNVIVSDDGALTLIDLERARIAHQLFDAAWFRCTVLHHHPERWAAMGPAFFSSAGIAQTPEVAARLDLLAALQCLEILDGTSPSLGSVRFAWLARLVEVIARMA
jgi:aminoglycoside phosphotransferase (APT) family kinase protein